VRCYIAARAPQRANAPSQHRPNANFTARNPPRHPWMKCTGLQARVPLITKVARQLKLHIYTRCQPLSKRTEALRVRFQSQLRWPVGTPAEWSGIKWRRQAHPRNQRHANGRVAGAHRLISSKRLLCCYITPGYRLDYIELSLPSDVSV
jgi:hypothetical protein